MKYNLSQIFVAEIVGTAMLVFFGDGGVANALLPNTKGHGIGFLGIAICFGMGVYLPLQILGHISALFNPAVAIAVGISGELAWAEVGVALAGETIGAFLGALLVWATYFKHFQRLEAVLPLRPGDDPETAVRVPRDSEGCLDHDALGLKGLHIHQELHPTASRYASAGNLRKRQRVVVRPEDAMHPAKKLLKAVGVNVSDKMHNMEEKMRCFVPTIPSYRPMATTSSASEGSEDYYGGGTLTTSQLPTAAQLNPAAATMAAAAMPSSAQQQAGTSGLKTTARATNRASKSLGVQKEIAKKDASPSTGGFTELMDPDRFEDDIDPIDEDHHSDDFARYEEYEAWEEAMFADQCRRAEEMEAERETNMTDEDDGNMFDEERPLRRDGALRKDGVPKRRPGPMPGTKYQKGGKPRPNPTGRGRGKWVRTKEWREEHTKPLMGMAKGSGTYWRRKKIYIDALKQQASTSMGVHYGSVTRENMVSTITGVLDFAPGIRLAPAPHLQHALDNTRIVTKMKKKHLTDAVKLNNIEAAVVIHLQGHLPSLGLTLLKGTNQNDLFKGFSAKSLASGVAKYDAEMNRDMSPGDGLPALSRTHLDKKVDKDRIEHAIYGLQVTAPEKWIALLIQLHEKKTGEQVPVIPLKLSMDARVEFKKGNQHVCEVTLEDIGVDGLNLIFSIAKWEGKDSHDEIRAHLLHEHPTTHEPGLLFKLQALFASGITMPDGRVIPVRLREGYDYVALCAVMGTKGPLATFFCPFCDINKNDKTKVLDDAPLLPGDTIHVLAVRHMLPHETLKDLNPELEPYGPDNVLVGGSRRARGPFAEGATLKVLKQYDLHRDDWKKCTPGPVTKMGYCARHAIINLTKTFSGQFWLMACAADDMQSAAEGRKCTARQDFMFAHLRKPTDEDEEVSITLVVTAASKYPAIKYNESCGGTSDIIARRLLGAMSWMHAAPEGTGTKYEDVADLCTTWNWMCVLIMQSTSLTEEQEVMSVLISRKLLTCGVKVSGDKATPYLHMVGAHTAHFNTNLEFHLGSMRNERVERHQRRAKTVKTTNGGGAMANPEFKEAGCYDKCGISRQMLAQYVEMKAVRDDIIKPVRTRKPFTREAKEALMEVYEAEVATTFNQRTGKPRQLPMARCEEIARDTGEDPCRVHNFFHNLTHRADYVPTNVRWRTVRFEQDMEEEFDFPPGSEEAREAAAARSLCNQSRRRIRAERVGSARESAQRNLYHDEMQAWWAEQRMTEEDVAQILQQCADVQERASRAWAEKSAVLA